MSKYMTKIENPIEGEVLIADAEGNAQSSGVTIGGSNFTGDKNTLATESGVKKFANDNMVSKDNVSSNIDTSNPSDKNIVTEAAFLKAMQINVVD